MAFPAPNTVVSATTAPFIILSQGSLINIANLIQIERSNNVLIATTVSGKSISFNYATSALAETDLQNIITAVGGSTIGTPGFTGILPATAAAGVPTSCVIRGRNFEVGGTVSIGPDAAVVTFVDSFTLLISITSAAPGTYSVVYTSPGLVTATLTNGFVTT